MTRAGRAPPLVTELYTDSNLTRDEATRRALAEALGVVEYERPVALGAHADPGEVFAKAAEWLPGV